MSNTENLLKHWRNTGQITPPIWHNDDKSLQFALLNWSVNRATHMVLDKEKWTFSKVVEFVILFLPFVDTFFFVYTCTL